MTIALIIFIAWVYGLGYFTPYALATLEDPESELSFVLAITIFWPIAIALGWIEFGGSDDEQ